MSLPLFETKVVQRYRRVLESYHETSREAWESIADRLSAIDSAIVRTIEARGGATGDEVETDTGMKHQTVTGQIRHLVEGGILRDSGTWRPNQNGRRCVVWTRTTVNERGPLL